MNTGQIVFTPAWLIFAWQAYVAGGLKRYFDRDEKDPVDKLWRVATDPSIAFFTGILLFLFGEERWAPAELVLGVYGVVWIALSYEHANRSCFPDCEPRARS